MNILKGLLMGLQLLAALGVIVTVLLHSPKAEGLGGIGGAARIFGKPTNSEKGLDKATYALAAIFVVVSVILAVMK